MLWVQTKPIDCVLVATSITGILLLIKKCLMDKKLPYPPDVHKKCVHYLNRFHFLFHLSKHEKKTLKKDNYAIEMLCKAWLYPAHPFWQLVTLFLLLLKLQKLEIKDVVWAPLAHKSANRLRWTVCRCYPNTTFRYG